MKVVVIGSGVAGLSAAVRLAVRGHEVHVFESNAYPGGKLSEIEVGGYRFDAGPSLYTMPGFFEELFSLAGKDFGEYCPYVRLDPITEYFFPDGLRLTAHADTQEWAGEIAAKTGESAELVTEHLAKSRHLYELTSGIFLEKSLHRITQQSPRKLLKAGRYLHTLGLLSTMHKANSRRFQDPRIVQVFDRYATYNGSDPYSAPATLNVIPHLEFNIGAFFPLKGMISLTNSMVSLGRELGVRYHFNSPVRKIRLEGKKATGILLENEEVDADVVVCNADIYSAYRHLMPDVKAPENIINQERSSSALIFYWGVSTEFPELDVHNILFSGDYEREFRTLFKEGGIYEDPTVYINISSKLKKDDAPPKSENWFVMINVPYDQGQEWDSLIPKARENILNKIEKMLGKPVRPFIEVEDILEPRLIASRTSSYGGALYGTSSNNRMAAFLRHSNFSSGIRSLYFCGGSVHPGGGIPLCMLSARIVDQLIADDMGQ